MAMSLQHYYTLCFVSVFVHTNCICVTSRRCSIKSQPDNLTTISHNQVVMVKVRLTYDTHYIDIYIFHILGSGFYHKRGKRRKYEKLLSQSLIRFTNKVVRNEEPLCTMMQQGWEQRRRKRKVNARTKYLASANICVQGIYIKSEKEISIKRWGKRFLSCFSNFSLQTYNSLQRYPKKNPLRPIP